MAKFLLVDTETTGFDVEKNQLLEVGLMAVDENMIVSDYKNILVKHDEYNVSLQALTANKINLLEHSEVGISLPEAVEETLNFIMHNASKERLIFMGQNCPFDIRFIENAFKSVGKLDSYHNYVGYHKFDLMAVAMYESVKGKYPLERYNLDTISKSLGIEGAKTNLTYRSALLNRHRALYDCLLELNCFQKYLDKPLTTVHDLDLIVPVEKEMKAERMTKSKYEEISKKINPYSYDSFEKDGQVLLRFKNQLAYSVAKPFLNNLTNRAGITL